MKLSLLTGMHTGDGNASCLELETVTACPPRYPRCHEGTKEEPLDSAEVERIVVISDRAHEPHEEAEWHAKDDGELEVSNHSNAPSHDT